MADEGRPPGVQAGPGDGPDRDPLLATAPFLSWRAIYALVLGALAVEVLLGAILTALFA